MYKTVFLSAGHGGKDSGAVGNNLKEKDINLHTLIACKSYLEKYGIKVICSRLKDENDDVYQEVREANSSGADIAVSFHANAGGGDGFECFYWQGNLSGYELAKTLEEYVKQLGQNSRGCKKGNHLYFIRNTKMPAVLVECAFIDNKKDVTAIDTIEEQKAFGVAYAKAILDYFGININTYAKDITTIAKEVISGKWGNGATRKKRLTDAGYNYAEVQAEVNRLLRG